MLARIHEPPVRRMYRSRFDRFESLVLAAPAGTRELFRVLYRAFYPFNGALSSSITFPWLSVLSGLACYCCPAVCRLCSKLGLKQNPDLLGSAVTTCNSTPDQRECLRLSCSGRVSLVSIRAFSTSSRNATVVPSQVSPFCRGRSAAHPRPRRATAWSPGASAAAAAVVAAGSAARSPVCDDLRYLAASRRDRSRAAASAAPR